MLDHRILFCCCAVALVASPGFAQHKAAGAVDVSPNIANGVGVHVQVDSVSKVFVAKDRPAYLISYQYDFGDRPNVYIEGLGTVSAKGSFEHLVMDLQLDFRIAEDGKAVATVPLQLTAFPGVKPPLDLVPGENEFPSVFRAYNWDLSTALQDRANAVLGKYFHYLPRKNDKLSYLATTYTPLNLEKDLSDNGVLAQVALLFSFPYDKAADKYSFHVQSLVQEGRTHSWTTKPTDNSRIVKAADVFVDKLVAELKAVKP